MVPIAAVLLLVIVVFSIAVVVSNPGLFDLSIFGARITANTAGVYFTGAGAMLVLMLAAALMYVGVKRQRARRRKIRALQAAAGGRAGETPRANHSTFSQSGKGSTSSDPAGPEQPSSTTTAPVADPSSTATARPVQTTEAPAVTESNTTSAERQSMVDEANALTDDRPRP